MLKNYLTVALRTLRRQKGYTAINLVGLAVGLACCVLIGLYVADAHSFDRFHEQADRTYRLTAERRTGENLPPATPEEYRVWGSAAIAPLLDAEFPEVAKTVRLSGQHRILLAHDEQRFQEERYFFADSTFFEVFSFPLVRGDAGTALTGPGTIVLSESAARRYFGEADPMGQPMTLNGDIDLVVTGVMEEVPANSHLDFDLLLSMSTFRQNAPDYMFDNWGYIDFFTYVLLEQGTAPDAVAAKFPAFVERHIGETVRESNRSYSLGLEPVTEAYLSLIGGFQPGPKGNPDNLRLFSFIGLFILLVACVNFMNLATARATQRAKEVGVRKTLGAQRGSLIGQFLMEATLLALVATGLAVALAHLALPAFDTLAGRAISSAPLADPRVLLMLGIVALGVGLVAGSYPAFVLSAFRPARVLKGTFSTSEQGAWLRQGLVVFQFAIAIALIASTLIVRAQLDYLQSQPLGFETEQQLVLDFGSDPDVKAQLDAVKAEFAAHPSVQSIAATRSVPGDFFPHATTSIENPSGTMEQIVPALYEIDHDFLRHLGVEAVAGRLFDRAFATDSTAALILNEAAVRDLGYADASEVIGKRFEQWGREGEVIGVVQDFNYESLHSVIEPLTFRVANVSVGRFMLRVDTDDLSQTLADLQATWATLIPNRPFLYRFLDDSFDALYRDDERFGHLFSVFAGLAILIACLGLFGLAAYTAQQRTKEIGVRKVLGASVPGLVGLLSKDLARLVVVGFVVASPLAYVGMTRWLDGFAYRTALSPSIFVAAGLVALAIALLTVSYHAVRAATSDPIRALRYE